MKTVRVILALGGLAALAWGGLLAYGFVTTSSLWLYAGIWLLGGPVLHDVFVAPAVAGIGLLITRIVPSRWRGLATVGLSISAVLILLAVPLLVRPYPAPVNPGLHNENYALALFVELAMTWTVVGLCCIGLMVRSHVVKRSVQPK